VTSCCVYQGQLIIGTDKGVFIGIEHSGEGGNRQLLRKVLDVAGVTQLEIVPKTDMLLVLVEKSLLQYPLRAVLGMADGANPERLRPKKIGTGISYIRNGVCNNMTMVCTIKSTALSTKGKVLEPVGLGINNLQGKFGQMFKSTNESLGLKQVH
jgi:hypothetical protein